MSRLQLASEQIIFARNYTIRLLDNIKPEDWFRQPAGGVTHIGWQVGHLAMAEYRLTQERLRGARPQDEDMIPPDFFILFGKDSTPHADPARYPSASTIRSVLDRVHKQTLYELETVADADLDQPILKPHPLVKTKLWALLWCAQHEMLHAGQIGLLRRLLGYTAIW